MAGLDPAIGYPHQFANDAIPVSNRVEPSDDVVGPLRAVRQQLGPLVLYISRKRFKDSASLAN